MTTWAEIKGDTTNDPEEAKKFIKWWFREGDIVAVRAMVVDGQKLTFALPRDDMIDHLTKVHEEDNRTVMDDASAQMRDLYINICPVKAEMEMSAKAGIKKADIKTFRGLFADIDCGKTGAFATEADVLAWVETIPFKPGAIVRTGTGGVHLWWKTKSMNQKDYSVILKRWWSYLTTLVPEGVHIDRLVDTTRVGRLPGATRFPKKDEPCARVTVEYTGADPIEGDAFDDHTDKPYREFRADMTARSKHEEQIFEDMAEGATPTLGQLALREALIGRCVELVTWEEILTGAGWTYLRTNSDGADLWERPGGHGKSGSTGYPDEEAAMSLHSTDEGTGLADLLSQEVRLSKWRVFLRLTHNDDVRAAERDLLEREVMQGGA